MTWFFIPRMLSAVLAIAILIVMTRVLGPAEFGRYNLTLLIGTLLFAFTFLWLVIAIGRFHHAKEFEGKTIATALGASIILAAFLFVISGLVPLVVPGAWVDSLFFAAIFCVSHAMHELGTACLRQYNEGPKYAAVTLLRHAIGVGLAVLCILNGGGYKSAVVGMSLGAAVTGAYALVIAIRRSGIVVPRISAIRAYLSFGFPLAIVSSSATFFAMSSQALIAVMAGMESAGYFAAAQSLATRTLRLPMGTLSQVIAPSVFDAHENRGTASSDSVLGRYFSFLMLISLPIVLALICSADVFANLLFEPAFADEASGYLRILAVASFVFGLQGAYLSFAFSRSKNTGLQLAVTAVLLLMHVLVSVAFIQLLGANGAAYAFLVSAILGFLAYFHFGRRVDRIIVPTAELGRAVVGALAFVPFGVWADASEGLLQQFALMTLGVVAMCAALVWVRQVAAVTALEKIRHRLVSNESSSVK